MRKGGDDMAVAGSFRKASRQKVKASIMIEGIQGTGKSGLALTIAHALASAPDKIAAIDTENQSLDLFDGLQSHLGKEFKGFMKVDLTKDDGYAPSNYDLLRKKAIEAGAEVVIMDSISHMWNRSGGMLDLVTQASKSATREYNAWGTDRNIREKELIFDLVRSNQAHIITTVRSKEKFDMQKDEATGRSVVVSLGEQQIQQDGLKYEPDLVLRMVSAGTPSGTPPVALVLKSRYAILEKDVTYEFDKNLLDSLKKYLEEGVDPEELLALQKQDVLDAIKEFCDTPAKKSLWTQIKKNMGVQGKAEDMPLVLLRQGYRTLTED